MMERNCCTREVKLASFAFHSHWVSGDQVCFGKESKHGAWIYCRSNVPQAAERAIVSGQEDFKICLLPPFKVLASFYLM